MIAVVARPLTLRSANAGVPMMLSLAPVLSRMFMPPELDAGVPSVLKPSQVPMILLSVASGPSSMIARLKLLKASPRITLLALRMRNGFRAEELVPGPTTRTRITAFDPNEAVLGALPGCV